MKRRPPAFQFYPRQWMGDEAVQSMDFDAQGMHFWLLCISWQRTPACSIPNDQAQLRRWLRNPPNETWDRVWPQIKKAWKLIGRNLFNFGMKREYKKCVDFAKSQKRNAEIRWRNERNKTDAVALPRQSRGNALLLQSSPAVNKTPTPRSGASGLTPRGAGNNPRAQGNSPRQAGTNPRAIEAKQRRPGTYREDRPPESELMTAEDIAKLKAALPEKQTDQPAAPEAKGPWKNPNGHDKQCACEECFETVTVPRANDILKSNGGPS